MKREAVEKFTKTHTDRVDEVLKKITLSKIKLKQDHHLTKESEGYILKIIERLPKKEISKPELAEVVEPVEAVDTYPLGDLKVKFRKKIKGLFGFKGKVFAGEFELSAREAKHPKISTAIAIGLIEKV